jgi:hypothetical protein
MLHWVGDQTQCLSWFEEARGFGAWPCEYAGDAEFDFQPLAHRFCLSSAPAHCVSQLIAAAPVLLHPVSTNGSVLRPCLRLVQPYATFSLVACNASDTAQHFEFDSVSLEFHCSSQRTLCLDWFETEGGWGAWTCHHAGNERFHRRDTASIGSLDVKGFSASGTTFCTERDHTRCVQERSTTVALQLRANARAGCLEFTAPFQLLRLVPCSPSSWQLWQFVTGKEQLARNADATNAADHVSLTGNGMMGQIQYRRDNSLCVDWFEHDMWWGVWSCDDSKPNQQLYFQHAGIGVQAALDSSGVGKSPPILAMIDHVGLALTGQFCAFVGKGGPHCATQSRRDGAVLLRPMGDVQCVRWPSPGAGSTEPVEMPTSISSIAAPIDAGRDLSPKQLLIEDDDDEEGRTSRAARAAVARLPRLLSFMPLDLAPCNPQDPTLLWHYDEAIGTFSSAYERSGCLAMQEADGKLVGTNNCERAQQMGVQFSWVEKEQAYCSILLKSMHLHVRQCVVVGFAGDDAFTVSLRSLPAGRKFAPGVKPIAGVGGSLMGPAQTAECFQTLGRFRLLEAKPCDRATPAQRWAYDPSESVFRLAGDSEVCVRYFQEARGLFAWTCSTGKAHEEEHFVQEKSSVQGQGSARYCVAAAETACVDIGA